MSEGTSSTVWNDDGPTLIDTSDGSETQQKSSPSKRTPPPIPSQKPVGSASDDLSPRVICPVANDLIQFESEEERAATFFDNAAAVRPTTTTIGFGSSVEAAESSTEEVMRKFLEEESALTPEYFMRQFYTIRVDQDKFRMGDEFRNNCAMSPQHYARNRYRDILPYDYNRVIIESDEDNTDGYMNASFVQLPGGKTRFIAAQAPLPNTLGEWWKMIDEQKVTLIVILCKLIETNKVKCERYWPEEIGKMEVFPDYEITLEEEITYDDDEYMLRKLTMRNQSNSDTRTIYQLHYKEWPDHGCPSGEKQLLNMIEEMAKIHGAQTTDSPILVHCSAGVGRTGTIIAVNHIREQMEAKSLDKIDVYELVMALRKQRASMVQTQDQYQFVHRCIAAYCRQRLGIKEPDRTYVPQLVNRTVLPHRDVAVNLVCPQPPDKNQAGDDEEDDRNATSVPDFPEEPPAPLGPEELGSAAL